MNEVCTEEESLDVENSYVGTHNLFNRKKQSLRYFLKKIVSVMYIPCTVLISVTLIMWNELHNSHTLITEI
jgi:hypothetical protein